MKNRDLFGFPIQFHFDQNGSEHRTVVGGFVSILIKVFMIWYIYILVKIVVMKEGGDI